MTEATKRQLEVLAIGGTSSLAIPVIELLSSSEFNVLATYRNTIEERCNARDWLQLDVASLESIRMFLDKIDQKEFDFILVFVGSPFRVDDAPSAYVETYLTNMVSLCQSLCLRLKSDSAMVHVSSRSSLYPSRDVWYSAVKGGMNSALRSLIRGLPATSKIISVAPGLVLNSAMANDMPPEIRAEHIRRASDGLLDLAEFAKEFVGLMANFKGIESGSIVELGPEYS
jgi:NAD(P)-dependent dehydrogenase (short-subunit alcohol dehydrogenase family)